MKFNYKLRSLIKEWEVQIKEKNIVICMGNESCDIDSFISSLVIAIHERAIWVVNISRKIFEAKGDLMLLVKKYEINLDHVIFLERPTGPFSKEAKKLATTFKVGKETYLLKEKKVRLILVDHHKMVLELSKNPVDLIIDHHKIGNRGLLAGRIFVDPSAGSCATLVSKYIGHSLSHKRSLKQGDFGSRRFRKGIAGLLMIPIMVDTANLKKVASHFDRGEFRKLKKITKIKKKKLNKFRKELQKARDNDADLNTELILRKDYKEFTHNGIIFGYATVKYSFKDWIDRTGREHANKSTKNSGKYFETDLENFKTANGLDFIIVNRKDADKRYLMIFSPSFEKILAEENRFEGREYKSLHYYSIPLDKSRKVMVPIINELMDRLQPIYHQ